MRFLSLDVGTTCCKCQVFDENGQILFYQKEEYTLKVVKDENYVDIEKIRNIAKKLIKEATLQNNIDSIAISSIGESFVLLDEFGNILTYPMLYWDHRGEEELHEMQKLFSDAEIFKITGTTPHAMYSIYKLLYLRKHETQKYEKARYLLLIGDYIGYLLTGKRVIDYALSARTGVFDIRKKTFSKEILDKLNIDEKLFSHPQETGTIVGHFKPEIIDELNLSSQSVLVLGSHDQVCATLGSGAINNGEAMDGMGTVECLTVLFDIPPQDIEIGQMGYSIVPYAIDGLYCSYILNYSSGSLVKWFRKNLLSDERNDQEFFPSMEQYLKKTDVMVLPYFAGAMTPYQDSKAKGVIMNLDLDTNYKDIYRAILEGTSMEMRLNLEVLEKYNVKITSAIATGGGSNSKVWLQIKSDICQMPIKRLKNSEGGLCGLAMIQAKALDTVKDYGEAKKVFVKYEQEFKPSHKDDYYAKYQKYKKIYKKVKEIN